MTEISGQRSVLRNRKVDIISENAGCAEFFLRALFATAVKPISDLRLLISGLCALFLALCVSAQAQQPRKVSKIGFLSPVSASGSTANLETFRQSLREFGYIEGKNIVIEYRWAEGKLDRLPELATELVGLGVDIIVTAGTPPVLAAKKATSRIPIVAANADNLVELGVVASLARPGGNVTGLTRVDADFSAKRLELLKESFPKLSRVAVLSHGALGADQEELQETRAAARTLGVQIQSLTVSEPSQFLDTYAEMIKRRADALIIFTSAFTAFHREQLVELATKNRLPTVCANAAWSNAGCLISYGPNVTELYRRAGVFVDKILKGTKPGDIPVEQPTKFEFIVNLKAAKQIGLTIPQWVLMRADRVIR
jgi:putative ABC transport system substrate-binding protein